MSFFLILLFFLTWRTVDNWILYIAEKIIPYLGFFPYPRELFDFGLPQVTSALANFDGIHYLKIASRGYAEWEQAFFPLYPLLIRVFNFIFQNELITGLIVSNVSFFIGLFFLYRYFRHSGKAEGRIQNQNNDSGQARMTFKWLILFILVFPTSFFFGAVYTEGLFFLLFVLTLYFLKKENYLLVSLFSILALLTRLIGVFLVIPILFHLIQKSKVLPAGRRGKSQNYNLKLKSLIIITPLLGLGLYCFYLWMTTGDPLFFLTSQPVFGANRSTNIILLPQVIWRYLKIFFTAAHNFQFYVSLFEFLVFILVFIVLIFDLFKHLKFNLPAGRQGENFKLKIENYDRLGLSLFSLANILLPTLTGTFSSVPRYALFSISFFLFLAEIKNKWIKIGIALIFLLLHIAVLGFFGQGYFVS